MLKTSGIALFSLVLTLTFINCQRLALNGSTSSAQLKHRQPYLTNPNYSELKLAQALIEKGQFSQALPKLLSIVDSNSVPKEVHYYLGVVYQELGSPQNALHHYLRYINMAPQGVYANNTKEKICNLLGITAINLEQLKTMEQYLSELEQKLQADPNNTELMLYVAGYYWLNQQYSKAESLYKKVVETDPELWSNPIIASRLEKTPDGRIVLLTPDEAIRREAEKSPIVFFNVTSFRSGRGIGGWSGDVKHQIYNVSGQVRNRSQRTLTNVNIQVTIYGFSGMVYETKNIYLGTLQSGQVKPFSVQFTNFDNIENVYRYDYVAYYD